jgi:hypothetical protein
MHDPGDSVRDNLMAAGRFDTKVFHNRHGAARRASTKARGMMRVYVLRLARRGGPPSAPVPGWRLFQFGCGLVSPGRDGSAGSAA